MSCLWLIVVSWVTLVLWWFVVRCCRFNLILMSNEGVLKGNWRKGSRNKTEERGSWNPFAPRAYALGSQGTSAGLLFTRANFTSTPEHMRWVSRARALTICPSFFLTFSRAYALGKSGHEHWISFYFIINRVLCHLS